MTVTVGLVMIVKDEADILARLADSVRDHIDYWTVVDTGSTDDTLEVLDRIFTPVPGQILKRSFDGYGPSRTAALKAAEDKTDWMLVLDADDTFHGYIAVDSDADCYNADCVEAEMRQGSMRFWLPKLLRSGRGWESRGRTHEYYCSPIASPPKRTYDFWIEHHGDGTGRAEKFDRDLRLLTLDWEDEPNPRTAFYLARSYDDMGQLPDAIEWYRTRLNMAGWEEETFYARYRLGVNLLQLGAIEGCGHLWTAWNDRPHRVEPLMALAEYYRQAHLYNLAWLAASLAQDNYRDEPGLFVDTSMEWRILYEISIAGWYTGHLERGHLALRELLARDDIPEPFLTSVLSNQEFYTA